MAARPGGCARPGPAGPRSCGSRSRRTARRARACPGSSPDTSSNRRRATRTRPSGRPGRAPPPRPVRFTSRSGHDHRAGHRAWTRALRRPSPRPAGPRYGRWCTTRRTPGRSGCRCMGCRLETHVVSARSAASPVEGVGEVVRVTAPAPSTGTVWPGWSPTRRTGRDRRRRSSTCTVERRAGVGGQRCQASTAAPERAPCGGGAALEVGERGGVRGDHPGAGTRLDGHVAHGHPASIESPRIAAPRVLDDGPRPPADPIRQMIGQDARPWR